MDSGAECGYERSRVKPKLVRKLSRRQQKQEMNPSVFAVLIPQRRHLRLSTFAGGGGACLLDLTIKALGFGANTALLMMNFWHTSEPSRHVQAALLTRTHAIVLNWDL